MKNTIVAGLLGCLAMLAISTIGMLAVYELPAESPILAAVDRQPTDPDRPRFETLAEFNDAGLWRSVYGFNGSPREFCTRGEFARSGKVYRTPKITMQTTAEFRGPFGGPVADLPQDGNKLYLTIVYKDRRNDPASQHLANIFMVQDHWLHELLKATHYRRVDADDVAWREYIAPKFRISEADLPCVLITEPPDKRTPEGRARAGRVVYYAPAWSMPWHPDELAYEIATQIGKRELPAASPHTSAVPSVRPTMYEQCPPNAPWCPRPNPRRPIDPDVSPLPPLRPEPGLDLNLVPGGVPTLLVIVCALAVVLTMFLLGRRR